MYQIFYEMLTLYDFEQSHNDYRTNDTPMLTYEEYSKISFKQFDQFDSSNYNCS